MYSLRPTWQCIFRYPDPCRKSAVNLIPTGSLSYILFYYIMDIKKNLCL